MSETAPKCFISYSWSNPDHEEWVLNLATELRDSGVDATLDKWDLKEGHDATAFMERMVTDPEISKVILVCDKIYVEKANDRAGGVGTETQIISPEIYKKAVQSKFVAVVRERDSEGKAYVPAYYGTRIHIDLSSDDLYTQNFEQLVRWIFDKPVHVKPPIGKPPEYLSDEQAPALGNRTIYRTAVRSFKLGRSEAAGAVDEFLSEFTTALEQFRMDLGTHQDDADEVLIDNLERFVPHRNELIDLFSTVIRYASNDDSMIQTIHQFFERILNYYHPPEGMNVYNRWNFDNYKFIGQELYIIFHALLLKSELFDLSDRLLSEPYYVPSGSEGQKVFNFNYFRQHCALLEHRNQRLDLRRVSLQSDLLKDRCIGLPIEFRHMLQADFVLYVRSSIDRLEYSNSENLSVRQWWPDTNLYAERYSGPFEIFARSRSKRYFDKMKIVLGINSKADLEKYFAGVEAKTVHLPSWQFHTLEPERLMGFPELATMR